MFRDAPFPSASNSKCWGSRDRQRPAAYVLPGIRQFGTVHVCDGVYQDIFRIAPPGISIIMLGFGLLGAIGSRLERLWRRPVWGGEGDCPQHARSYCGICAASATRRSIVHGTFADGNHGDVHVCGGPGGPELFYSAGTGFFQSGSQHKHLHCPSGVSRRSGCRRLHGQYVIHASIPSMARGFVLALGLAAGLVSFSAGRKSPVSIPKSA